MNTNSVTDIRDIKGLVPLPGWPWWVWTLLGAAVLAVAGLTWWLSRRKPAAPPPPRRVVLAPADVALQALARLREEQPPVELFYTRLADIVRHYIEGQFGLRAPERTTEEFLAEATLPAPQMGLLGAFLREADLVKFARVRPGDADRQRAYASAETFVRETAPSSGLRPPPA